VDGFITSTGLNIDMSAILSVHLLFYSMQ